MGNQGRKFKVLVIAISLRNNQIAKSKEVVDESQLSAPIEDLISGGFIEEVVDESQLSDFDKKEKSDLKDISNSIPGGKFNKGKK